MSSAGSRPGPPDRVVAALRCPVCGGPLERAGGALRCGNGHTFDIARQGYVNLLPGGAATGTADTAAMVADRAEFLAAGHYAPLAGAVAELAAARTPDPGGLVVDAGAGVGYYLGGVLGALPDAAGLALDLSAVALRRTARRDARIGAAVSDVWRPWPVADGVAAVVVNVFAPRNGPEFRRVLRDDGVLVVATPGPGHLAELGPDAGLLSVDPRKSERLAETLGDAFDRVDTEALAYPLELGPEDARRVVGMGPAGHHGRPAAPDGPVTVTASFMVSAYRPR